MASAVSVSSHPDFPNDTEVINIHPRSEFFGQRGLVYGSGPSQKNPSSFAVVFVKWPDGERHSYFPSRLAIAPLQESKYKVSKNTRDKKLIMTHEVPATKRPRPTIFELAEKAKSSRSAT